MDNSKIIRLNVKNVLRLNAVEIVPDTDGNLVIVGGRNAQGKSSVLDAIEMALGGARKIPGKPIHDGAESGQIVLETDGLVVVRSFKNGKSSLTVRSRDGGKYGQALLDDLTGQFTFDPLSFLRETAQRQREILEELVGLDLSDHRADVDFLKKQAKITRADLKNATGAFAETPDPPTEIGERVNLDDLFEKQGMIEKAQEEERAAKAVFKTDGEALVSAQEEEKNIEHRLRAHREHMEKLKAKLLDSKDQMGAANENLFAATAAFGGNDLRGAIAEAQAHNQQVEANEAMIETHGQMKSRVELIGGELKKLEDATKETQAEMETAIASCAFPIPGLSFGDDGILFDGIPFEQISQAEKLRVSVAMGLAMNPKLRICLLRDGSHLDADSLAMVAEMAREHDAQLWVERVGKEGASVVIEDGYVADSA